MVHVDSMVTVPAGTFKTVSTAYFFKDSTQSFSSQTYANGIRMIKAVTRNNIEEIEYSLLRYHLE